ncbi:hypothetical protein MAQ58_23205, partial [Enterobacter sp. DRP3]|nr:hypothetical protein [Enterobacter sp. DRP3]
MNLVEGKDAEGRPLAEPQPERDRQRAITLVHAPDYHAFKARIMKPLDDLYGLIEHRTNDAVQALQAQAHLWFLGVIGALVATVAAFLALAGFGYKALLRGYASIGAAMER